MIEPRNTNACVGHSSNQLATNTWLGGSYAIQCSHNVALVDFHVVIAFDPGVGEGVLPVDLFSGLSKKFFHGDMLARHAV